MPTVARGTQLVERHSRLARAVAVVVLLVAAALALRFLPVERLADWLNDRAEALGPWAPAAFVLLFVSLTVVLLPGWPLNVLAGVIFGPLLGALWTVMASNSAAAVSFLIGRRLGRRTATRLAQRYPKIDAVYRTFGRRGSWRLVAAVRLSHAMPFGLQNFLLGASPVSFWSYLLTTIAVTLPGICVIAYLGYLGASWKSGQIASSDGPWPWVLRVGGVLMAAGAVYYLGRTARRAIQEEIR